MNALGHQGRATLLMLARAAIREALLHDGGLERRLAETALTPELEQPRGVFVTLRTRPGPGARPELRGCIGNLAAKQPLYRSVIETARRSALEDPRFEPLAPQDLDAVRIEVSVLGPFSPLPRLDDLDIGRHGVQLCSGAARSLFLPHVAAEQGWSRIQLLRELARKAGLPDDAWTRADLSVFEADCFGEEGVKS